MRIGINGAFLGESPTGVGVFTRQLARALKGLPREVRVFSSVSLEGIGDEETVPTPPSGRGSRNVLSNAVRFAYTNVVLPYAARRAGVDVLFCPITEYAHSRQVPQVVHVHDLHPLEFPDQFGLASPRFRWELGALRSLRGRVTVSSRYVRDLLLLRGFVDEASVDVVPLGCDHEAFFPSDPAGKGRLPALGIDRPYVLYVGSMVPYKNAQGMLKAFETVSGRIPHLLVMVGCSQGGGRTGYGRVRFHPRVSRADLRHLYSFADAVVYPSLSEGFGLVPLEAMACGAPVLASDRASIPEVTGDAAVLFDPADPDGIGEKIRLVMDSPALAAQLRAKAVKRAALFSWERTAGGIAEACGAASRCA